MFIGNGATIHGDEIKLATNNKENAWVNIFYDNVYVGSVWIDNKKDIDKFNRFMEA